MKLFSTGLGLFLLGQFCLADWHTDTQKTIDLAKKEKKNILVWFHEKGEKLPVSERLDKALKGYVLLDVELGSSEGRDWEKSYVFHLLGKEHSFVLVNPYKIDEAKKPDYIHGFSYTKGDHPYLDTTVQFVEELSRFKVNQETGVVQTTVPAAPKNESKSENKNEQTAAATGANSFEQEVLQLVNAHRARHGVGPLAMDPALLAAAQQHASDMAGRGYFSHSSQNGRSPFDRMRANGAAFSAAAENIAAGQSSPQEVVQSWINSGGHNANMLNGTYNRTGVGYVAGKWVQTFAR